ncbi:FAD binding domain-containing protein [Taklimakanibacter lacteus]|uniref:FAD binding domain-containing protein n=1 Tax=Taklimakanibacter lacteus TaxID=2268456 RepID=UPI000E673DD7
MNAYIRPTNLAEATKLRAKAGSKILCGGTDFYPALGTAQPQGTIIDLTRIAGLDGISVGPQEIRIGACTSWTKLIASPLPPAFDALKAAGREVGSIQIQNRATIGGNLCNASPAADGVPPLLALEAEVELASAEAMRRLALSDFILGNRRTALKSDEILTAIIVPQQRARGRASSTFAKLGARHYLVISIAMVAVNLVRGDDGSVADAKIAVGACSAVAQRLRALEADLLGKPVAAELGRSAEARHLADLSPIDDVRATGTYRRDAALLLVRRVIGECAKGASA